MSVLASRKDPFHLRPQDILLLLKLIVLNEAPSRQIDLAQALGLSQAEVANALERLRASRLLDESKRRVQRLAAAEFLIHAIKYIAPADLGAITRGIPTAHSAKPLSGKLALASEHETVWPHPEGNFRGASLRPIYSSAPDAALKDPELHEWLALIDVLRIGKSRAMMMAEKEISRRLVQKAQQVRRGR